MLRKTFGMVALAATLIAQPAFAQDQRVEIGATAGWTFSDGVDTQNAVVGPDGNFYGRIDPKDSFKWGVNAGGYVTEQTEIGFMFSQQMSVLQIDGTQLVDVGDLAVNNYHGYFAYNFGFSDSRVRPYAFGGLGATQFGEVEYTRLIGGGTGTTGGDTQFSTTWGLGVKLYPSPNVGLKLGVQWTPTYIRSDAGGYWCDPYWGCYMTGDPKYANQWDLAGGLTFRF
jgi:opacity protein-like surface antigen